LITCNLTKLETANDQVRKAYPKLKPADAALLASALSLTGRHALAVYDEKKFKWPEEIEDLTRAMIGQLEMVQEGIEASAPKKVAKTAPEEEPVVVNIGLAPNLTAGENILEGRNDLKTLLSDVLQEGVEFVYSPGDLGWQWALDRANWSTLSSGEISRRIKIKANFTEGAVGVEMGAAGAKKRPSRAKAAAAAAVVESEADAEAEPEVDAEVETEAEETAGE
jgi:hypothetical protein